MRTMSVREARQALTRLDELLAAEGEITITRRGLPIARLVPIAGQRRMPSHSRLRASMPLLRKGSERVLREERDER